MDNDKITEGLEDVFNALHSEKIVEALSRILNTVNEVYESEDYSIVDLVFMKALINDYIDSTLMTSRVIRKLVG